MTTLSLLGQIEVPDLSAEFQPVLDALPPLALIGLAVLVVAGLVLWIMGRTLAKAACVISGLLLGALAGLAIGRALADQGAYVLPLMIGGGIAGALLAALLFRLWMGLVAAIIFGLLAPAAVVAWQQVPPPPDAQVVEADQAAGPDTGALIEGLRTRFSGGDAEQGEESPSLWQHIRGWYDSTVATAQAKWAELPSALRHVLLATGGIGTVAGLIFGLVAPNLAASLLSALLGAIMMYYPGKAILEALAPDQAGWLPGAPGPAMATVGLITLAGFAVQWMLFRRSADKR